MSSHERHRRTLGPEFEMTPEKMDRSSLSLAVPSPSIRRSARLQDSPSVNYNVSIMSKRNGTSKRHTNKRIFGLDASDMNNTSTNLSLNNVSADETQLNSSKGKEADLNMSLMDRFQSSTKQKLSSYSQSTKMLIASLVLVLMLFIAEQSVYYLYLSLCWSASSLSQVRTIFFSFQEIISSPQDVPSSDGLISIVQDLKLKFEEDLGKLNAEVSRLQHRNQDIENEKLQLLERITNFNHQLDGAEMRNEDDSVAAKLNELELQNEQLKFAVNDIIKDHVEQMSRSQFLTLEEKFEMMNNQIKLLTRTKDNSQSSSSDSDQLMSEIEKIKETIRSIRTNSNSSQSDGENYISLALAKFPVLSSIGEKFENFESRTSRLEEKLNSEINLIIEKHSHNLSEHLEAQIMTQVETVLKIRNQDEMKDKLLDWANSGLGTKLEALDGIETHPDAVSTSLKLYGFSVWKQVMKPSKIIQRPHEGKCWPFSGTSGSLLFTLSTKISIRKIALTQSPSSSAPRDITLWDHDREAVLKSFTWNLFGSEEQSFDLENGEYVQNVRLDIASNWGDVNVTCVGKIQLLGTSEN